MDDNGRCFSPIDMYNLLNTGSVNISLLIFSDFHFHFYYIKYVGFVLPF